MNNLFAAYKESIINGVKLMMENEFRSDLNALADGQKGIVETQRNIMKQLEANSDLQNDMDAVKAVLKTHTAQIKANTAEIENLKKAQ